MKELRGFSELIGYYRNFVRDYGTIAWQLKKDDFQWGDAATNAFEKLKLAMTSVPVLALPDFSQSFIVETDASRYGLGAVLQQNQWPIETGSIVFAMRKW